MEEVGTGTPNSPNVSGFAFVGGSSSALGASMATLSMGNRPRSQSPAQMMQSSAFASAQQAGLASDGSGTGMRSLLFSQHQYNLRSRPASFHAPATPLAPMSSSSAAAARDVADGVGGGGGTSGIAPPSRSLTSPRHSPALGVGFSKPRCSLYLYLYHATRLRLRILLFALHSCCLPSHLWVAWLHPELCCCSAFLMRAHVHVDVVSHRAAFLFICVVSCPLATHTAVCARRTAARKRSRTFPHRAVYWGPGPGPGPPRLPARASRLEAASWVMMATAATYRCAVPRRRRRPPAACCEPPVA